MRERRRYVRARCETAIKYRKIGGEAESQYRSAMARDISAGGIRFVTDRFMGVQSSFLMELQLPKLLKTLRCVAKPAWVREVPGMDRFELGSAFAEISADDMQAVEAYVKTALASEPGASAV
jgi:c-di-GMP-binding flagellar brake protein YcgR